MDSASHLIEELAGQVFPSGGARPRQTAAVDQAVWSTFQATGLDKTLTLGDPGDIRNASIVLRAAGSSAAFVPASESMLANWLASRAGWDEQSAVPTVVTASNNWSRVPWGRFATAIYFLCEGDIARCRAPTVPLGLGTNIAGEPRDEMCLPDMSIEKSKVPMDADELLCLAALCRASMMIGAMHAALQLSLEHATQRIQFGRPIGQFQAVQQMLAQFAAQAAAATAAVDLAVSDFSAFTAAVAKARVSEAVTLTTEIAHQVCGAMGFTMEYPLQRFTRRLWAWRDEDGDEVAWNRRVGAMVANRAIGGIWPLVSDPKCMAEPWQKM